jgi:hypothetical protein
VRTLDIVEPELILKLHQTAQSSQISKTFEQLSLAVDRKATQIWIVNVGDLKPYELGIDFFMTLAWNSSRWNVNNLDSFVSLWAQREFDLGQNEANEVATIIGNLTRWNNRRKPELLNSTTFSLSDYRECVSPTMAGGDANPYLSERRMSSLGGTHSSTLQRRSSVPCR